MTNQEMRQFLELIKKATKPPLGANEEGFREGLEAGVGFALALLPSREEPKKSISWRPRTETPGHGQLIVLPDFGPDRTGPFLYRTKLWSSSSYFGEKDFKWIGFFELLKAAGLEN